MKPAGTKQQRRDVHGVMCARLSLEYVQYNPMLFLSYRMSAAYDTGSVVSSAVVCSYNAVRSKTHMLAERSTV